jgi:hypothetical protein
MRCVSASLTRTGRPTLSGAHPLSGPHPPRLEHPPKDPGFFASCPGSFGHTTRTDQLSGTQWKRTQSDLGIYTHVTRLNTSPTS